MQDRYAADYGDFVKLALLRTLAQDYHVGVAWWRFPNEAHNGDGKHVKYLEQRDKWRHFDPDLFDSLASVVDEHRRSVQSLQDASLLARATYVHAEIPAAGTPATLRRDRLAWFKQTTLALADAGIVFADPDNGLEPAGFSPGSKNGGKAIAFDELRALATPGRTIIVYHHQTRRKGGHIAEIVHLSECLRGKGFASVDAIRSARFSPRVFFVLNAAADIRRRMQGYATSWAGHLSWHPCVQAAAL